ncbi:type IV toxin-antitoxin system AbiEi family antitoxin domain-containing protein [Cellulomonas sp. URHB0016]
MPARRRPPLSLLVLARRQGGLVSATQCDAEGVGIGVRRRLVSTGAWDCPTRGVYDPEPRARRPLDDLRQRSAWLGLLAYGPDAIAVGQCALALHGVAGLPSRITPEVALPAGRWGRPRDGMRVRCFDLGTVHRVGAGRVTSMLSALVQAVPELPRHNAVAVLDDVSRRGRLGPGGLDELRRAVDGRRRAVRVRPWWQLVDARAESPLETFARLQCHDAGIPPDDLQVEIRSDDGAFVGRGDLGWRLRGGRWLLAEMDGRDVHEAPAALLHDRRRQNALLATGRVDVLRFTSVDVTARTVAPTIRSFLTH